MMSENQKINKTFSINAPVSIVWSYLTTPDLIKKWMLDPGMQVDIITDWKAGNPIVFTGDLHHEEFENKGTILKNKTDDELVYTHLSSLSRLPDTPENFCVISFKLATIEKQTQLSITISDFPTESIYKHLDFYWGTTIKMIKKIIEQKSDH